MRLFGLVMSKGLPERGVQGRFGVRGKGGNALTCLGLKGSQGWERVIGVAKIHRSRAQTCPKRKVRLVYCRHLGCRMFCEPSNCKRQNNRTLHAYALATIAGVTLPALIHS